MREKDWLDEYLVEFDAFDGMDILDTYRTLSGLNEDELPLDVTTQLIELPCKLSRRHARSLLDHVAERFALDDEGASAWNTTGADNADLVDMLERFYDETAHYFPRCSNDTDLLAGILSYSEVLPEKTCQKLALKLLACYGTLESALQAMRNPIRLNDDIGFDAPFAYFLRKLCYYLTGIAMSVAATASPALADGPVELRRSKYERRLEDSKILDKDALPCYFPRIESEIIVALLKVSDDSRISGSTQSNPGEVLSLVSDRDILIGVWWVYWSMKRLRDCTASAGDTTFLWDILTNRTPENSRWLDSIKERCVQGYTPKPVRMIVLPKAGGKTRLVPVICAEDKVALTALYAACYKDMERNDKNSGDHAYKYPPSFKIDQASALNYVPRAFWYRYLDNYLTYVKVTNENLEQGRYIAQTDIASFVHNIRPEVLFDSMQLQGYDPALSQAIYQFHKTWNDQDHRIGVPFGNSLTTAGMKIVLHRISLEMKASGYDVKKCYNYADDFTLIGDTKEDVEKALDTLETVLNSLGLQINDEKTCMRSLEDPPSSSSVEDAVDAAYEECGMIPYVVEAADGTKTIVFEVPESLTLGGEIEPAIESEIKMSTVPPRVLKVLYHKHVKLYLDRGEVPVKGVAGFTLYRMLQCRMPEAKVAFLRLYEICPHEQGKLMGWLNGQPEMRREILPALVNYYQSPVRMSDPYIDYSRFLLINSLYKACEEGSPIRERCVDTLIKNWWLDPDLGFLARRELDHLAKIDEAWAMERPDGGVCRDKGSRSYSYIWTIRSDLGEPRPDNI